MTLRLDGIVAYTMALLEQAIQKIRIARSFHFVFLRCGYIGCFYFLSLFFVNALVRREQEWDLFFS